MHLKEGSFELDFKIVKLGAKLAEEDRQCAWELYTEMVTRVAVVGKADDKNCANFDGEVLSESFDSLYRFFQEARGIMRRFPVGRIGKTKNHLGITVHEMMRTVLRPFLEKWHADFRHWLDAGADKKLSPMVRQTKYPKYKMLQADWQSVRLLMRSVQGELIKTYGLVEVTRD
jgi:hypothetical protein